MTILDAAATQTMRLRGVEDTESGSTSPRKRNSRVVMSFRMKNAVESYVPIVVDPWLMAKSWVDKEGATLRYGAKGEIL